MADISLKTLKVAFTNAAPYGNTTSIAAALITDAAGAVVGSDSSAAVGIGDVVAIAMLPAGMRLDDDFIDIDTIFASGSTFDVGFKYADGVDDTDVPEDDVYFTASLAADAGGRTRSDGSTRIITLPKDAYLIVTNKVAAQAQASAMQIVVQGVLKGE